MSDLYWLTDEQMARLQPYFPKSHGRPRVDDRRVLSGIVFVNRNGLRWCDAPKDAILADLEQRKPPGFEGLIDSVSRAKGVIQDGLNRPLDDFLEQQDQQLQIGAQIVAGRTIEAEVLRQIFALEKQRTPLSSQQKLDVLAPVTALKQQERQLERN